MSDPMEYGDSLKEKVHGAITELISAQSALNMEPSPIEPDKKLEYPSNLFLSNTDHWVKHSMTHIRESVTLMMEVIKVLQKEEDLKKFEEIKKLIK